MMSRQAALSFILKANEDKVLFEKVNALPSSRVETLLDVAREAGFEFTADEFVATVLEQVSRSGELKQEDLEQVAGGAAVDYFLATPGCIPTDQISFTSRFVDIKKFG
jgi:predicted ribosomally synthesized peptide with nif11-like leader